jgi:C1A family cysteine protease
MSKFRNLTLGALTLVTVASVVGCGQTPSMMAPSVAAASSSNAATVTIHGVSRKLGYDWTRYQKVQKSKAHPQHLIRQGLRPKTADLRTQQAPVYDQGQLGSCTAFAIAKGLRESLQRKDGEQAVSLSALFQYYETRKRLDSIGEDSGGTITDGVAVLKETGAAPDAAWPYEISKFKLKPPAAAYSAAGDNKVHETTQLASLDDVKSAIASGQPVAFGFLVYKSMMSIGKDAVLPLPKAGEKVLGGHAVLAVGYDDEKQQLIVRNSWGSSWGDKGYFYMPYKFVTEDNTADFWTAK